MKITIFGAAGDVGSRVVAEALSRGHEVTAVVRNASQFKQLPESVLAQAADAGKASEVARVTRGQDAVLSAIRPPEGHEGELAPLTQSILAGVASSQVRVLMVGGAACLKIPDGNGNTVLTEPGFLPDAVRPIALACFEQYQICMRETRAQWTYLSPPAMLTPGQRSGQYRLGSDTLLIDSAGNSQISMEDFAVALLDETENPRHTGKAFTVAGVA